MKAEDVVARLASELPRFASSVTDDLQVLSITRSGTTVTVQTSEEHDLEIGEGVVILGAKTPISVTSLTRVGPVATAVLATSHDMTPKANPTVTLSGSNEAEFNGTFTIVSYPNSTTIKFSVADSGPLVATGSPIVEDGESALRTYDGYHAVATTPGPSTFTFELPPSSGLPDPVGQIEARVRPRVSATVDVDRAVAAYTEQAPGDVWLFVALDDVTASRDRDIRSDATENLPRNTEYRQQIVQPFTVYAFFPSDDSIGGRQARDAAEDLFRPLCRALLFKGFDSGLYVGVQGTVNFVAHGSFRSDRSTYVHAYSFSQVVDLVFEDTVGHDLDVRFDSIDLSLLPSLPGSDGTTETESMDSTIALDEPPTE